MTITPVVLTEPAACLLGALYATRAAEVENIQRVTVRPTSKHHIASRPWTYPWVVHDASEPEKLWNLYLDKNYEDKLPHRGLARGHNARCRTLQMAERLQRFLGVNLIFGHDEDIAI